MASDRGVGLLFLFYQRIIGALVIFQKQLFIRRAYNWVIHLLLKIWGLRLAIYCVSSVSGTVFNNGIFPVGQREHAVSNLGCCCY